MLSADIEKLVKDMGQGPAKVFLEVLARNKQFKAAIKTPIGIELLSDLNKIIKDDIDLILNGKDTLEVRAEIKVCKEILNRWSSRISKADKDQMRFNTITERI